MFTLDLLSFSDLNLSYLKGFHLRKQNFDIITVFSHNIIAYQSQVHGHIADAFVPQSHGVYKWEQGLLFLRAYGFHYHVHCNKNEEGCRDDIIPKTSDTRRPCEVGV